MIDQQIAVSVAVITYNMQRYLPQLKEKEERRCLNYPLLCRFIR